ncbi:gamma-glutamyltransferase [Thermoactinomyces mirandus]|uniref:Glutathione hydrolase proenzyme n=1 Tax=Thermoactinomyces mirandus TaxID=2756294 RepID=A0A7W1XS55_9BACL|nr:gamma-glutamyltransferase [Thermoactinomyces mirandus]MBA4602294.1 gamma-glutamyltransferase [Thermoactinomyces mirandus]
MSNKKLHIILAVFVFVGTIFAYVYKSNEYDSKAFEQTVANKEKHKYGVAAAHPEAVQAGMQIMEQGGNAVDAAIAVSYVLGVVEPYGSGIGGGGTMLIDFYSKKEKPVVIDYRETAPYTGIIPDNGVGVPGFVKGMELAHDKYGKLPMSKLIQPAIELSEQGFEVTNILSSRIRAAQYRLPVDKLGHMFPNGEPIQPQRLLVQKELANTLKAIQKDGAKVFYQGLIASDIENISRGVKKSDLQKYEPLVKEPLIIKYNDYQMVTPPPPTGGVMLAKSLRMADQLDVEKTKDLSADQIHLLGEVNKRVNYVRRQNVGDPRFVNVPVKDMLAMDYIEKLARDVNMEQISLKYNSIADSLADKEDHDNTTHFVVVDKNGNMVCVTNTLSNFFGSGIYVDGFFLNNQLKNFSINKSSPNRPQLGKRPLSYTAPTIFTKNDRPVFGIGSAGGSRITPILTEVIIRILEYDMPVQAAINRPRFIVEDNMVYVEKTLPAEVQKELEKKGYQVVVKPTGMYYGGVQGIRVNRSDDTMEGGFDGRRDGAFRVAAD